MTTKEIAKQVVTAYDSIAKQYQEAYGEADEFDLKYVDRFVRLINGHRVLDLGCGIGTTVAYLSHKGFDVIGIDNSKEMLNVARNYHPQIRFEQMDILQIPSDFGTFDGVVMSYVINHFNDAMLVTLKQVVDKLLSDNGVIFVSAHLGEEENVFHDPLDDSIQLYYHFLSEKELNGIFADYDRLFIETRSSFGEEEFLCDKVFVAYRKRVSI